MQWLQQEKLTRECWTQLLFYSITAAANIWRRKLSINVRKWCSLAGFLSIIREAVNPRKSAVCDVKDAFARLCLQTP